MSEHTSFRDQLLAVEPPAADVRHRIEQEICSMMVRKLKLPARIFIAVVALASLASAGLCGYLAATEPALPLVARVGLGTGVLFGLAWAAWSLNVLRSGEMNLRRDPRLAAQMVWVFTVLMVMFFLVAGMSAKDRLLGILMILQSLAFLIGAAVYWLSYRIEAAELTAKEQLLRTELQITELLERR
jgi:hypothetical protein